MEDYYDEYYPPYEDYSYSEPDYGGYTYDPDWDMYYSGDPSIEDNWVYSPPGQDAPTDWFNYEDQGDEWQVWEPGEQAPADGSEFSSPYPYPGGPSEDQQVQAISDWMTEWGLGGGTAEAWVGDDGTGYTKDYEGNVFDQYGSYVGSDAPTPSIGADALAGMFPGPTQRETGGDGGPGPRTQRGTQAPGATDRNGNVYVYGVGYVDPNQQVYMPGHGMMSVLEAADLQKRQLDEKNAGQVESNRLNRQLEVDKLRVLEEKAIREAKIAEQRAKAEQTAQAAAAAARAQEVAQQATLARERMQHERDLATQGINARQAEQRQAQVLQMALSLLEAGTGPNGPANRRMALALLAQLGVPTEGNQGGAAPGEGMATNPLGIPPALWDQMPATAKQMVLDAYLAQGGDANDFNKLINDQRPRGQPSGSPRVRYAAPVG